MDENARVFQQNAEIVDPLRAATFEDPEKRRPLGGGITYNIFRKKV